MRQERIIQATIFEVFAEQGSVDLLERRTSLN
jgi:hypothetical protein